METFEEFDEMEVNENSQNNNMFESEKSKWKQEMMKSR